MRQIAVVKVLLEIEAEYSIDKEGAEELLSNIRCALANWVKFSEAGLCPERMEGYTDKIVVFLNQVYKPEV